MSIVYRIEKGAPLTSEELDGNFRELETKLNVLEENQEVVEGLAKIQLQEDILTFTGSSGKELGSFPLPKASFPFHGEWQTDTQYKKLDMVTYENHLSTCLEDHTSKNWVQDQNRWKIIFFTPTQQNNSLPLYERGTLPKTESLGKIGLLVDEESPTLIFYNGKSWQYLLKREIL